MLDWVLVHWRWWGYVLAVLWFGILWITSRPSADGASDERIANAVGVAGGFLMFVSWTVVLLLVAFGQAIYCLFR